MRLYVSFPNHGLRARYKIIEPRLHHRRTGRHLSAHGSCPQTYPPRATPLDDQATEPPARSSRVGRGLIFGRSVPCRAPCVFVGASVILVQIIHAARAAILEHNWTAALVLAMAIPDICSSIDATNGKTDGRKYAAWWNQWVGPIYRYGGADFLSGDDVYALRCSMLHNGTVDITSQRARDTLDSFQFNPPPPNGSSAHCNLVDSKHRYWLPST